MYKKTKTQTQTKYTTKNKPTYSSGNTKHKTSGRACARIGISFSYTVYHNLSPQKAHFLVATPTHGHTYNTHSHTLTHTRDVPINNAGLAVLPLFHK